MKAFKHPTSSHLNYKLDALRSAFGSAGYGRYWIIVEKALFQYDGATDRPRIELSWESWEEILDCSIQKCRRLLTVMDGLSLIEFADYGKTAEVEILEIHGIGDEN